jgi:hypothetical protein
MSYPSAYMSTVRIMMRPVDDTTFRVPFVLAEKFNRIAFSKIVNTPTDIDVVGDKKSLTRRKSENEPLVSTSLQIVRQNLDYHTGTPHLYVALPVFIGTRKKLITRSALLPEGLKKAGIPLIEPIKREPQNHDDQQLLHIFRLQVPQYFQRYNEVVTKLVLKFHILSPPTFPFNASQGAPSAAFANPC